MKTETLSIESLVGLAMNCPEYGDAICCAAVSGGAVGALVAEALAAREIAADEALVAAVAAGIAEDRFILFQRKLRAGGR